MSTVLARANPTRMLACNRTLNMRAIKAVGYDMDYTLIDYHVEQWEERAYEHVRKELLRRGWPVENLTFSSTAVTRGLVVDTLTGNIVKANRFGFIKKAVHGARALDFDEMRTVYARTQVELSVPRWQFMNTLFSISEGCLYRQLVDLLDAGKIPGVMGYADLYQRVRDATDAAHMLGELKGDIVRDPARYVFKDDDLLLTLLDQKRAGKKLLLITNSEWSYTRVMMQFVLDPQLSGGLTWRDLFDVVIVSARKPTFFTTKSPLYEVVDDEGLLRPVESMRDGVIYAGGSSVALEHHLGVSGDEILYVGDHMFGDVHVTKDVLRWRTALVLRELEEEIRESAAFADTNAELRRLMHEKEALEHEQCTLRVRLMRHEAGFGPHPDDDEGDLRKALATLKERLSALDARIAPLASASAHVGNPEWGLLLRAGNDKSLLARQVERYADVYTSRVSNFMAATPFVFLRSPRGTLPHDPDLMTPPPSLV
jgi:5'-nucleotidase